MEKNLVLIVGLFLLLLVIDCSGDDLEVKPSLNADLDLKNPITSKDNNNSITSNEKQDNSKGGSKENVDNSLEKSDLSGQSGLKEADGGENGKVGSSEGSQVKKGDDNKQKSFDGFESDGVSKEHGNEGDVVSSKSVGKEGGLSEELLVKKGDDNKKKLVDGLASEEISKEHGSEGEVSSKPMRKEGGSSEGSQVKKGDDNKRKSVDGLESEEVSKEHGNEGDVVSSKPVGKKGGSSEGSRVKKGDDHKQNSVDGLESEEVSKEKGNEGGVVSWTTMGKESSRGEECDSSNSCTADENKLIACLRVPGNESPHLSLLIQNKGKGPLTVTIDAPNFVQLEKTKVQLKEKENKKVKVSIRNGGTENMIVLTAGNGRCSLDFRDLIAHHSRKESDSSPKFTHINFLATTPTIVIVSFAALLILASSWTCISFRRRRFSMNGSKYQKLEMMELPVSGGGKSESDVNDGWDNSWGDSWDDEEAPKTPSMPITPSVSSKSLAPRRFSKEGWKD